MKLDRIICVVYFDGNDKINFRVDLNIFIKL